MSTTAYINPTSSRTRAIQRAALGSLYLGLFAVLMSTTLLVPDATDRQSSGSISPVAEPMLTATPGISVASRDLLAE